MCAKGRNVAKDGVFPMDCGYGGSNSRLAKVASAEPSKIARRCSMLWREARLQVKWQQHITPEALLKVELPKTCMRLWREADFEINMCKARSTFWKYRC